MRLKKFIAKNKPHWMDAEKIDSAFTIMVIVASVMVGIIGGAIIMVLLMILLK